MKRRMVPALATAAVLLTGTGLVAQRLASRKAGEDVRPEAFRELSGLRPSENLLFNGWGLTPAGVHVKLAGDLPLKMVPTPDGGALAVLTGGYNSTGVSLIDLGSREVRQFLPLARGFNGLAFSQDGKRLFVSGGASGILHSFDYADGKLAPGPTGSFTTNTVRKPAGRRGAAAAPAADAVFLAALAVHPTTGELYVCNEANHEVLVIDPGTLQREDAVPVGMHPHSLAFGADRRHLYVSNWGGRSVSVVDTESGKRVRDIEVGMRPNDMALAKDGRLFVACSGDNTVHVIQTRALEVPEAPADRTRRIPEGVREILSTSLYPSSPEGSTPDGVAIAPDGKTLFVANADNNAVMVADISDPKTTRVEGFIPVGWYPSSVAVTPDSGTLLVGNGKGLDFGPNYPAHATSPTKLHKPPAFDYIGRLLEGSISFVKRPTADQMASFTDQVRKNSPYTPETLRRAPMSSDGPIPDRVGAASPIKHVLYIIKENRTYDQVFGDFRDARGARAGNGDPNLTMFGEDVAPNHYALAREYVLLDNLYCNGEVSVDGHAWSDAAIATDFNQRRWITSYSGHGTLPGNDEMEAPSAGYVWDVCRRGGVSFKCYGEGSWRVPMENRGTWPTGRDKDRVSGWIQDLKKGEETGDLPQFMIMSLGEDHTSGTAPGKNTPDASVASNDIGLGRIVEAASRSKFWKEMAIFVIEDDAQNGPDHVDAHRTVGLVISPYVRRGTVDSTMYSAAGMLRTMELILGLPPMTQYDAGATPMFNCFQKRAQVTAYQPRTPKVDVNAVNGMTAPGAKQSKAMDFSVYDRAPEDELNRILWRSQKGPGIPYPAPNHRALFTTRSTPVHKPGPVARAKDDD